ncbi:baseplate J/gp47 family protein [Sulfurimonas sp.]|uniref:baseplate J/gp47 family protein n=1 Tax=Sulfurimonas sp. TaxID=2022749 RepID=UPI0025FFAA33|nr:baseplate J/gp47 family protein [Sulfurimonas sp.]
MINIAALAKPNVLQVLDYEYLLNQNITNFQVLDPEWIPLESDVHKMQLEATASRELHLRAEFNILTLAFFLSTATGTDLDNYAVFYNVERLKGSKPYADYEFSLSEVLTQDIVIPANLILTDDTTKFEAKLLNSITIVQGETKVSGTLELQFEISTSDIKTEIITTLLPFIVEAKASAIFANGSSVESDEELRARILLSMADKSTAGSEETYKSFTFKADERVQDVKVINGIKPLETYVSMFFQKTEAEILEALIQFTAEMATVEVYYYSSQSDSLMQTRIEEMLNKEEVRPLSDKVIAAPATEIPFSIEAQLKILPNQETATVYSNAMENLNTGINSLKQIGTDITLSEINDFLKVTGVKEVVITSPVANVSITDTEIGVNSENTITYSII